MIETIGIIFINSDSFEESWSGLPLTGGAYSPVEEQPNGKVRFRFPEQVREMRRIGLLPMIAVRTEITRHGTTTTHTDGYGYHLLEGDPESLRSQLNVVCVLLVLFVVVFFFWFGVCCVP